MKQTDCIFCKIAGGDIPSATIYEDKDFRVILDLSPAAPGHALILPKSHYQDLCDLDETIAAKVMPLAAKVGNAMKAALGCTGFNVVQNNGSTAGQTVFHFHTHIIPRYNDGVRMLEWQPQQADKAKQQKITEKLKAFLN